MGSLKSPCMTSYRSSIATIALNCLVFEKIAFFAFWRQTDKLTNKLTDEQTDSSDGLSRTRCHERRLNNPLLKRVLSVLSIVTVLVSFCEK